MVQGELFSMLLRLHPTDLGWVSPSSGPQVQAAFLDMVRQGDPELAAWLHEPNQRRPYTVGMLQGFNHLSSAQLQEAASKNQPVQVTPGQVYWLRVTMLDATVFSSFTQCLLARAHTLSVHIGQANFTISRLLCTPDAANIPQSWVAHSSFEELYALRASQKRFDFEFATPTAFSQGQKAWGKLMKLFPDPSFVFENLARQWDIFAPSTLRMEKQGLTSRNIESWCQEYVSVAHYTLETRYLPSTKFGFTGFQGHVSYEVHGSPAAPEAQWLSPLARFALFSGVGYKTAMGMGQARCTNLLEVSAKDITVKEVIHE